MLGVLICDFPIHRFSFLAMLGLYVFDLSGHRFWFLFLRCWAPFGFFLGTTTWACGFEFGVLLISESRLKPSVVEHGFRKWRGFCAGTSDSAGRNLFLFKGCRSRFLGFRGIVSRFVFETMYPDFWHVGVPICELLALRFLVLGVMGLYAGLSFLRCWTQIVLFFWDHDVGISFFGDWRLANVRTPFENITFSIMAFGN